MNIKIKTLEELIPVVKGLKVRGKKIVLGHGVFDLLHYGHIHYFKQARAFGDILIVSVVADKFVRKGQNSPQFNQNIRMGSLAELECVDFVVLCDDFGPWEVMEKICPHIYARGDDSISQLQSPDSGVSRDKRTIESLGGEMRFTKSLPIHSTKILNDHFRVFPPDVKNFLEKLKSEHTLADIRIAVESLQNLRVLTIGEAIIDEYCYVRPLGKPSKANIIATQYLRKEEFAGGILACANHAAGFVQKVDLLTFLGESDSRENFIRSKLQPNIIPHFFNCPGRPTVIKTRYIDDAYFTKFFELCTFDGTYLPKVVEDQIAERLSSIIDQYDLVIVIDYGHGFLSKQLRDIITNGAKYLAINVQTNSANTGFNYITKYSRANYVCIDENEARLAVHDKESTIEEVMLKINALTLAEKLIVTMGHKGSISYEAERGFVRVPSFADKVTDPVGAGDAYLAISALCAVAGLPLELVAFIGNIAGSIAVNILGNKFPVDAKEFDRHLYSLMQ